MFGLCWPSDQGQDYDTHIIIDLQMEKYNILHTSAE